MNDGELAVAITGHVVDGQAGDAGERRRFGGQAQNELLHYFWRPLNFNGDSGGGIADRTSKLAASRETIDIRAESDALHDAGNFDLAPDFHGQVRHSSTRSLHQRFVRFASFPQPVHPFLQTVSGLA